MRTNSTSYSHYYHSNSVKMTSPQATGRYEKLQTYFQALTTRAEEGKSLIPDTRYANFLKDLEHQALPNLVQQEIRKAPSQRQLTTSYVTKPHSLSPGAIRRRAQKVQDANSKRLKAVQECMWQQRQEERAMRSTELNIRRQKSQVQRFLTDYESSGPPRRMLVRGGVQLTVGAEMEAYGDQAAAASHQFCYKSRKESSRKQSGAIGTLRRELEEANQLQEKEHSLERYRQRDLHQRKKDGRKKLLAALTCQQKINKNARTATKRGNELGSRYCNMVNALDQKKGDLEKLDAQFRDKMRAKEQEQHKIEKDIAHLSLSLKMEAQKVKKVQEDILKQQAIDMKNDIQNSMTQEENLKAEERSKIIAGQQFENNRRQLHQSLREKQDKAAAKQRQGGRDLLDLHARMHQNNALQRMLSRETQEVELDALGKKMTTKTELVESRRRNTLEAVQRQREDRNTRELVEWEKRYYHHENEAKIRKHGDALGHLNHLVGQYDYIEKEMCSRAKEAEAEKHRRSKVLTHLQQELSTRRKQNGRRLQDAMIAAEKVERELRDKIQRENAELLKAVNLKDGALHSLALHKARTMLERDKLADEKKEQLRRIRIQNQTMILNQFE